MSRIAYLALLEALEEYVTATGLQADPSRMASVIIPLKSGVIHNVPIIWAARPPEKVAPK